MAADIRQPAILKQRALPAAALATVLFVVGIAQAQSVVLSGRMGDRALLVIDGTPKAVAVGQTVDGVRLLRWQGDAAEVERAGARLLLNPGGAASITGTQPASTEARAVVLSVGPGGHFTSSGAINGRPVQFMVDTGATLVSLGRDEAGRLGIDLKGARIAYTQTANGAVPVQLVTLSRVRVGDIELVNVNAAVMPQAMPMVLLGNSFLARLQMRRENDQMRLEMR